MDGRTRALANEVAREKGIMKFQNSDAHNADTLGKHFNTFNSPLENVSEFIKYVQETIQS